MKAVILAGGLGTRLSEETAVRPKPMVEIGEQPILWHILKTYSHYGINDFIVCAGYKGHMISEWFANYRLRTADVTFDFSDHAVTYREDSAEKWKVSVVHTGDETMTGGRLRRVRDYVGDEAFCFTYGDGVADINITELIDFHRTEGREATMTVVQPAGRFGAVSLHPGQTEVDSFMEKPKGDGAWINGGFFVLEPSVIDRIDGDATVWEQEPMRSLAHDGQLSAYRHEGFWQPMDTLRDKVLLESLWDSGEPPWKVW
ncbi:MAG TPA: glucose-1-phosphate cytidylyltransferase [Acidimicrobiia bacterium]|nr:glucose-1-phosphate cytidylyltransferase [Acidimicrobiia bacterium]